MKYLCLAAMGEVDGAVAAAISERLERQFALPVRRMDLPAVDFAYDSARRQYGSVPVLTALVSQCPDDALKLVALTERDLFIPALTFVYGQAQLGGRVAVVSLARLRQEFYGLPSNPAVFLERALKEALHETGHTFGLVHCAERECAMSLATNIRQIDSKRAAFCASCAGHLRRRAKE
ncbi:MAG TPA: archaemetzincin [Bryobacteraceae bacterium]|nr:archaemetzincin [Bryobacteraceae bacterium]